MIATTKQMIIYNIMTSSQARDDEMAPSATRSTSYPWERVRAEHGGAGGAVPTAHGSAGGFESVARSAVGFVLGLHGTAALPEMTDRKGTAVDRPVGGRWRSFSPVIRGRFRLFCPVCRKAHMWAARAAAFSLLLIANRRNRAC